MNGEFAHIFLTSFLFLPAFASLALGLHLLGAIYPGYPLASYGGLLFPPYVTLYLNTIIGIPVLSVLVSTIMIAAATSLIYFAWRYIGDLVEFSADQRILGELLLQTLAIAICSMINGPATHLYPPAFDLNLPYLPPLIAREQWLGFSFNTAVILVLLPILVIGSRHQRLLLLSEDRSFAISAGLVHSPTTYALMLVGFVLISASSFTLSVERGFNINFAFSPFIYSLSLALTVQSGRYILLILACFAFVCVRGLSIVTFGSWIDDILAWTAILVAVIFFFNRKTR